MCLCHVHMGLYVVCMCHVHFLNIFIIILHAPLLCSNTTCIGGFLHIYIISTKIPCSIYKFVKLTIIVYNLAKDISFVNFLKFL